MTKSFEPFDALLLIVKVVLSQHGSCLTDVMQSNQVSVYALIGT